MRWIKNAALLIFCVALASCSVGVRTLTGIKSPVVETKSSVSSYWEKQQLPQPIYFFKPPADTISLYTNVLRSFNSDIQLFDRSGNQLCYGDTNACLAAQISDARQAISTHFHPCATQEFSFSELVNQLQDSRGGNPELGEQPKPDYYLIVFWSKFASNPGRLKKDVADYETLVKEANASVQPIYVNTDLLEEYGLETGKKLRFRYLPAKAGFTIHFGEMPFKKNQHNPQ